MAAGQIGACVAVDDVVAEHQGMVAVDVKALHGRVADDDGLVSRIFFVELRADPEHVVDLLLVGLPGQEARMREDVVLAD